MSNLSPEQQFESVKTRVADTVKGMFPIVHGNTELKLHSIEFKDAKDINDIRAQREALDKGKTWSVPAYADVSITRNGKVVDRKKLLLLHVPKVTGRFGYIVNGSEKQILNQFRLKSGVYHRRAPSGELLAEYNLANPSQLANGKPFKLAMDPGSGVFYFQHRNSKVPLYPLLKTLGISDSELRDKWGEDILAKNQAKGSDEKALKAFVHAVTGEGHPKVITEEHKKLLGELLAQTKLREDTTARTLGKAYSRVEPDTLVDSTKNLLDLSRGAREEDDRNALEFQSFHSAEDLLAGHLGKNTGRIQAKIRAALPRKRSVRGIVSSELFDGAINRFFSTSLVGESEQTNPLSMLSGQYRTTIMGEQGGVKNVHAIMNDARLINPSHLSFLDPVHTPEGAKVGVTLSLPLGVRKRDNDLVASFYSPKTGKLIEMTSAEAMGKIIAFPDQFKHVGKKLRPIKARVKASQNGEIITVEASKVDAVIPSPRGLYGASTNLIPFLQNNQGTRAMTASRQQEQAVPLLYREAPLVQSKTDKESTFEEVLGGLASHRAPVGGTVEAVKDDAVILRDAKGKRREVQIYRNFPLQGKSLYDADVVVKPGDKIKEGDLLADTTFTRGGTLALGTNLRTAYMPWYGYNFEDGVVISESAAKKLTSLHAHKKDLEVTGNTIINRGKFLGSYQHIYSKDQVANIADDGVIRVGSVVKEGDPLVLALEKPIGLVKKRLGVSHRQKYERFKDRSLKWEGASSGVVTKVVRHGDKVVVHVKTEEPMQVGDKLVGRHGNKGVVTRIVSDSEMPFRTGAKGEPEPMEIILNPLGVPGRINLGQVLETAEGKAARKRGKPLKTRSFDPDVKDYLGDVERDLKAVGLSAQETLTNPKTGKPFDQQVFTGEQYILKLRHQVERKLSARSGSGAETAAYDLNQSPVSGAPHGGQSMGELGLYALLAHGARNNIYEMYNYKAGQNREVWDAIRDGAPIPPPKVPFVYDKLLHYMNGMRLDVRKQGNSLQLIPFTEAQVKALSAGELKEPGKIYRGKDLKPEAGGLFDEKITGGVGGTRWSHFTLAEPMPNPLFEEAIKKLTEMSAREFKAYVRGDKEYKGKRGGEAIEAMLKSIDVTKELATAEEKIKTAKGANRDKLNKKIRILRALKEADLSPSVYMMRSVPVIPPVFRPVAPNERGGLTVEDINGLYKDLGATNEALGLQKRDKVPDALLRENRLEVYDGLKAMTGLGGSLTREYRGILDTLSGKTRKKGGGSRGVAKEGFFQRRIIKRRQDFTARSTIIPEPRMDLDELGMPEDIAWSMYQPFIERELVRQGMKTLDAIDEVKRRTPGATAALNRAVQERPVLLKRDPVLHKFGVMAFKPRLVQGKAIEIHPLVTGGYNADFDGDAMSMYLPLTTDAVSEAKGMYPSNNLFSPTTGAVMYTPGHEALLGIYLLSTPGKKTNKRFATEAAARSALRKGEIKHTDVIRVGGHETTVGRLDIEAALPPALRETGKKALAKMGVYDKKGTATLLRQVAKRYPAQYGEVVNKLKDLGNDYTTNVGFSFGIDDFKTINTKERDSLFGAAERKVAKIQNTRGMTADAKETKIVATLQAADDALDKINDRHLQANQSNIFRLVRSGARGDPNQLKQIVSTPALVVDARNRVVPFLVPRSYSEGMDTASYWTTMHGARKGFIDKGRGTAEPGYLSKQIINGVMDQVITEDDCGARDGVQLSVNNRDVVDRYLSKSVNLRGKRYRAGTIVTPELVAAAVKANKLDLPVRSPMRCKSPHGVCKKCMGLSVEGRTHDVGTNVGILASQAIGEPSTQLAMKCTRHDTLVPLRRAGRVWVSKLEDIFSEYEEADFLGGVQTVHPADLEAWDGHHGWVRVKSIQRHEQALDTQMVFLKTQLGGCTVTQDNHPLWTLARPSCTCNRPMVRQHKHEDGRLHFHCNTCRRQWEEDEGILGQATRQLVSTIAVAPKQYYAESDRRFLSELEECTTPPPPYLLGAYAADGCVRKGNGKPRYEGVPVAILFTAGRGENSKRACWMRALDEEHIPYGETGDGLAVYSPDLAFIFSRAVQGYATSKTLHPALLGAPLEWLADFLCGYADGDGTIVDKDNTAVKIYTSSFAMLQWLQLISARLGMRSTPGACTFNPKTMTRQPWQLTIYPTSESAWVFDRCDKWQHSRQNPTTNNAFFPDLAISEITLVKPVPSEGLVYDIETETGGFNAGILRTSNTFHQGGLAKGMKSQSLFDRLGQLLKVQRNLPNKAPLASLSGTVGKIEPAPQGGSYVYIGDKRHYAPGTQGLKVKRGQKLQVGDSLTNGVVDPKQFFALRGARDTQDLLANEVEGVLHRQAPVKRRNVELIVKSMTGLTVIDDPGGSTWIPGDKVPLAVVEDYNRRAKRNKVKHTPVLTGVDVLPTEVREDWLARMNYQNLNRTLTQAAREGWRANPSGFHPIPAIATATDFNKSKLRMSKDWKGQY